MDNQNAKKKFEEWLNEKFCYKFPEFKEAIRAIAYATREYALREAASACNDDNSRENIENLI